MDKYLKFDYFYFKRRYEQIEKDFLELIDFIEPQPDFNSPCYQFGSSKLMDFCLKVCTEIETLFRLLIDNNKFDLTKDITKHRKTQNIEVYRKIIGQEYNLHTFSLFVNHLKIYIKPFRNFDKTSPKWFKSYSKHKHDKLELINEWNLEYALFSLGALLILVFQHPSKPALTPLNSINTEVFRFPNPKKHSYFLKIY